MAMTDDEVRGFVARMRWTFAKSMPHIPHEYIVRGQGMTDEEFERFVMHIRAAGADKKWGKRTFRYLALDGHEYWTMGAPLPKTRIINRARIKHGSVDSPVPARGDRAV